VRPPRLPVTLVALVTKKLKAGPDGAAGISSSLQPAVMRMAIGSRYRLIACAFLVWR
jgi:hypothetical protein